MKKQILFFLLLIIYSQAISQNFNLKIKGENEIENKIIDSIGYKTSHVNTKSIIDENNLFLDRIRKEGYCESNMISNIKIKDSIFQFNYSIGGKTNFIHIYVEEKFLEFIPVGYTKIKDTIILPFKQSELFLNSIVKKLEINGFSMARVKLINIQKKSKSILADLSIQEEIKRKLNDIVIKGTAKFPESHKKNILRLYQNKVFNQKNLENLYTDFEKIRFVKQTKYPEILFTKDSTKVYVYLEKAKSNTFDGFVGFTNDENKNVVLNGYLDLSLNNILNSGEKIALNWKSDGKGQKTFNLGIDLPYIFKSPLVLKTQLNIFKQDSTFQNTQTSIDLGYLLNYNKRFFIGYQSTESNNIKNLLTSNLSSYNNSFVTSSMEFVTFKSDDFLFPEKTRLDIKTGFGKRESKLSSDKQIFSELTFKNNFYLNDKNIFYLKTQHFYLQSNSYIINELHRFGGINSIRGFNENSLQGNLFSAILTEYRFVISPSLYAHSILDYAIIQDKTTNTSSNLYGIGIGIGILSKNGLFNLVYANGSTNDQTSKLSNSIVHVSFKATF